MRRIDLSPYKVHTGGKSNPAEKVSDFLSMPQVAVLKRLATERLGISVADFNVIVMEEVNKPEANDQSPDYLVRESMVEMLFNPSLGLSAKDLLDRDPLARRIKDLPGNDLLLEEEEYKKVLTALEALRGLGRHDVEFAKRVLNAPTVEVQAKPAEAQPQPTSK